MAARDVIRILRGQQAAPTLSAPARRAAPPASWGNSFTAAGAGGSRQPISLDPRAKHYSSSAVAYRCVQALADAQSSVDLQVLRDLPDQGEQVVPHPVTGLYNVGTPGAALSARLIRYMAWAQMQLAGETFLYVDRGPTGMGTPAGLYPIQGRVEILTSDRPPASTAERLMAPIVGFRVRHAGLSIPLLASEVLWLRFPDPFDPLGALAPWKAALFAAEADQYARAWQVNELRNGARPSHVVHIGDVDENTYQAAVAEYRANVEGPGNAGRSLIVAGSGKPMVERLGLTPAEMSYLESRTANGNEIITAFGLTPDYLNGGATFENRRVARAQVWGDTIVTQLDVAASEFDRQLVTDPSMFTGWDLSGVDAMSDSSDAVTTRMVAASEADLLLLDEARAQLGYGPLPDGLGELTHSAYLARIAAGAPAAFAGDGAPAPARMLPAPRTVYRVRGATRPLRLIAPAPVQHRGAPELATRRKPRGATAAEIQRFYRSHERTGRRAVEKLAERQQRVVLRNLEKLRADNWTSWAEHRAHAERLTGLQLTAAEVSELAATAPCGCARIAADDVFDAGYWRQQTQEMLDAFVSGVWEGAGQHLAGTFGLSFDVFDAKVLDTMTARLGTLSHSVTDTTRSVLDQQLLQPGVAAGESIDKLRDRVRAVFGDLQSYRAEAIARTETVGGFNGAAHIAAAASGVVRGREWLATSDDRTRATHRAIDGHKIDGMDGRYPNELRFPGDPTGPASETINCRCTEIMIV